MAFDSFAVSVGTTPTSLVDMHNYASRAPSPVLVQNLSAGDVYVGDASVTTVTGTKIIAGGSITLPMHKTDLAYAIVAAGTADVRVLVLGA